MRILGFDEFKKVMSCLRVKTQRTDSFKNVINILEKHTKNENDYVFMLTSGKYLSKTIPLNVIGRFNHVEIVKTIKHGKRSYQLFLFYNPKEA